MKRLSLLLLLVLFSCTKDPVMYDVTISATEGGTVSPQSGSFEEGSSVTLTATPNAEYEFTKWSNGSTQNPLVLTVTSDLTIQATFTKKQYELTISKEGEGTVNEKVINSGKGYDSGTRVELTAVPAGEWVFAGWSGDVTSTDNPLQVTISSPKNIKAKFVKRKYPLTINIEGQGTVTEEIVNTGRTTDYDSGTTVKLTAVPAEDGWEFSEWTGDIESNDISITLLISQAQNVTAVFNDDLKQSIVGKWDFETSSTSGKGNQTANGSNCKILSIIFNADMTFKMYVDNIILNGDFSISNKTIYLKIQDESIGIISEISVDGATLTATFNINNYCMSVNVAYKAEDYKNRIILNFYDIPEDQDFKHIFFSSSPGWNQYIVEKMLKKIILFDQNDQFISEKTYVPEEGLQIDLPVPSNNLPHYLREYLYYNDENYFQGNQLLDNFLADGDLFNFRFQYELIFTTPVYSNTKIEYELKYQNDALLLVDKNLPVRRVGVGSTGFAPGGRHIYVNSRYDSYPIRLYFDSFYIDKIVNTTKNSTTIIEVNENDISIDYPVGSTDQWINDPIYAPLKTKFDKGELISYSDYVNAFKLEAQKQNIDLNLTPEILTRSYIDSNGAEYLAYTENPCTEPKIYLNPLFHRLTFGQQIAVIYHEFGHAYFKYDHEDFGLMLSNVSISQYRNYTAFKGELTRFFIQLNHQIINCSSASSKSLNVLEGQKINKIFFKL